MSLLTNIVAYKKKELARRKVDLPLELLKGRVSKEVRDFKSALKCAGISIIAEIKQRSPSAGVIKENFDPIQIAKIYQDCGAHAISVLTDSHLFGGSNDYFTMVKKTVALPVLRKDFIIDEYQIYESRYIGADAILLIARILTTTQLMRFIIRAKELGLACLVEIHSEVELKNVLSTPAEIVGINNRNLDTLRVDLETSLSLKKLLPQGYITVCESGIKTREDVKKIENAGFDALLVGETIMKSDNICATLKRIFRR
jgi:indole-3-glycerol phosphate synthase